MSLFSWLSGKVSKQPRPEDVALTYPLHGGFDTMRPFMNFLEYWSIGVME